MSPWRAWPQRAGEDHDHSPTTEATASYRPIDLNGPVSVPFEALPDHWVDVPVVEALRRVALRHPEKSAIHDQSATLSYRGLVSAMDRLAAAIRLLPRCSGAVGVLLPNSAEQTVAMLAVLAAGRSVVPFDPHYPPARTAQLVAEAALDGIVVADQNAIALPPELRQIPPSSTPGEPPVQGPELPGDGTIILHTSGSTGRPKAIVIGQPSLLQRVMQHVNASHIGPADRICPLSSPCTISGLREQLAALLTGATLHVIDPHRRRLDDIRRSIADERISIVYAVPALLRAIVAATDRAEDFASLRVVRLGGDTVLWRDIALLRQSLPATCRLQIGFSSTESPGMQWFVPSNLPPDGASVPLGYELPGSRVEVLDEAGAPVRPGEIGELVIRGRFVALGVWEGGACVPGPFRADPGTPGARINASGDLVRLRPDGLYAYAGRKDRQIKIRGQRVDGSEIEAALRAVPGVADSAIVAVTEADETSLAAFIQTVGDAVPKHAVDAAIRDLPTAMRPRWLHYVADIPRLPSAKPDLAALRLLDKARRSAAPARGARSPEAGTVERVVARAWHDALGPQSGEGDATWTESGGDSLRLLSFALALERRLGCDLPLDLFDGEMRRPEIVASIERRLRSPTPDDDTLPRVFFFPGIDDDNPHLARFRRLLRGTANFETIDYPDWQTMIGCGGGLERLVELSCERILALPPHVPVRLAGYSFGGAVALALCVRLLSQRRQIEWLAVFDTDLENFIGSPARTPWAPPGFSAVYRQLRAPRSVHATARSLADLAGVSVRPLLRRFTNRTGWTVRPSRMPPPARLPRTIDLRFRSALRLDMMAAWLRAQNFDGSDVPVTLFRADHHPPGASQEFGWSLVSRRVEVIRVGGEHATMFGPNHSADLATAFARHCLDRASVVTAD